MTLSASRNQPEQQEDAIDFISPCQLLRHYSSLVEPSLKLTSKVQVVDVTSSFVASNVTGRLTKKGWKWMLRAIITANCYLDVYLRWRYTSKLVTFPFQHASPPVLSQWSRLHSVFKSKTWEFFFTSPLSFCIT